MTIPFYKSDLKDKCPEFLIKSSTIKSVLEVEDKEHDRLREILKDIQTQCFIETATWGLSVWEEMAGIVVAPDTPINQRRATILAKLQFAQVSTKEFLEALIKEYCSKNTEVVIEENNPSNTFRIFLNDGDILNIQDLLTAIEEFKPAHLAYGWGIGMTTDLIQVHESEATIEVTTRQNIWNRGQSEYLYWNGKINFNGSAKWNAVLPGEGYSDTQIHELTPYKMYTEHQFFNNDTEEFQIPDRLNGVFLLDGYKDLSGSHPKYSDIIKHSLEITEVQ